MARVLAGPDVGRGSGFHRVDSRLLIQRGSVDLLHAEGQNGRCVRDEIAVHCTGQQLSRLGPGKGQLGQLVGNYLVKTSQG